MNCQGSRWGDFATINRWVEINIAKLVGGPERPVFLVHRLDRATTGLMFLAHSKKAAQIFSELFRNGQIDKRYQAIVKGDSSKIADDYEVKDPIDDKDARTILSHVAHKDGRSLLDVRLLTGRKHQIRRHLSGIGFPVFGDRLYGGFEGKSCDDLNLQLQAVSLNFTCPFTEKKQHFAVADELRLQL